MATTIIVKKRLPLYTVEPSEDCIGFSIAELYCNDDGSDWGYYTQRNSYYRTNAEAKDELKRLMDEAVPYNYREVNWPIELPDS